MTELEAILTGGRPAPTSDEEWGSFACARGRAMLAWLGLVSPSGQEGVIGRALTDSETRLLCDAMVRRFVLPDGELAWSSHMLGTAVTVVGATVEGPPEPLLHSVWDLLWRNANSTRMSMSSVGLSARRCVRGTGPKLAGTCVG